MRRRPRRLVQTLAAGSLLAGLLAAPVAAGSGSIIYVDDDGKTGTGGCNGTSVELAGVQAAIDIAASGDTIRVCPGRYPGRLRIAVPDLTLGAVDPLTAIIVNEVTTTAGAGPSGGPPVGSAADSLIWVDGADRVHIRDLTIFAQAPAVVPTGTLSCLVPAGVGVSGYADGVVVAGNVLKGTGPATLGPCGLGYGILFVEGSSGRASGNLVWNFVGEGITGAGPGTSLRVVDNEIRFWHKGVTAPAGGSGAFSCTYGAGVVLSDGATGRIVDTTIKGLATAGYSTPLICPAIYLTNAGDDILVEGNLITNAYDGINTDGTDAWTVKGNRFLDSRNDGLLVIGSRRGLAQDNIVRGSIGRGIVIEGPMITAGSGYGRPSVAGTTASRNNTFRGNSSTDNTHRDCLDPTTGTKTKGTANTWVGNHSDGADLPNGICPR